MRFYIVVTGYNCEAWIRRCVESIYRQSYPNWKAVLIDDCSTDGTSDIMDQLVTEQAGRFEEERFEFVRNMTNRGAALSRYQQLQVDRESWFDIEGDDIILLLGMDDMLLPGALERIAREYENGKWMTYGSWVDQSGRGLPKNFPLHFDRTTHKNRDYRKVKYRSTAPNTFYKWLFDLIPADEFKYKGEWIRATTESHLMFSCLEMCGEQRIGVIKEPIYMYQKNRKDNARNRFGSEYQDEIYADVISRPKKDLIIDRP